MYHKLGKFLSRKYTTALDRHIRHLILITGIWQNNYMDIREADLMINLSGFDMYKLINLHEVLKLHYFKKRDFKRETFTVFWTLQWPIQAAAYIII